jgi:PQQ-dependent dehydrogenase (methanol/ethanol family)
LNYIKRRLNEFKCGSVLAAMLAMAAGIVLSLCCAMAAQAQIPADILVNPYRGQQSAIDAGRKTFNGTCAACHGAEASGGRGPALNSGNFPHGDQDHDLFSDIKNGISTGGMPAFGALPDTDIWQLVAFIKSLSTFADATQTLAVDGDDSVAEHGKTLFFGTGGCSGCHEINGEGQSIAADLSAVGTRGINYIRATMLHPAGRAPRVIDAVLASGETVRGIVRAEDSFDLLLLKLDGEFLHLDRRSLRSSAPVPGAIEPTVVLAQDDANAVLFFLSRQTARAVESALSPSRNSGLSANRIVNASAEPQNWLTYWGDYHGDHFSSLSQINKDNVALLQAKWAAALPGASLVQATPIVVDGVMYVSGPPGDVYALDAKSGLQLWKFSRKQDVVNPYQINPYNRGVAVLQGRVFVGTLDNLVIAIDARTGRELWERRIADTLKGFTITGAPLALKDRIVVGVGCGEYGVRGFLESYDAATGRRLWRVETIPGPGEPGNTTWPGDSWQRGGGGTWLTGSYDPQLNLLYWAVGNPAPYNNWKIRAGDNLHTDSVLALNPDTGALIWSYQFTPNDSHDWDSAQDMVLADRVIDGKERKVIIHADRNGFLYVLDRTDGEFLSGRPFVRQTWNDGFGVRGRPRVRPDSVATPAGQRVFPTTSATNFQAPSFDQRTGRLFLVFRDTEGFAAYGDPDYEPGRLYTAPARAARPVPAAPLFTGIRALAVDSGAVLWTFPLTRFASQAGVLATQGDILFAGSADGSFIALDSNTGAPLWHFRTGGQIIASPISYAADGHQFVALAVGNQIYSFALPDTRH